MNKKLMSLLVVFSGIVFLGVGALTADDTSVPDEISIASEGYAEDKKGPVPFTHGKHADKEAYNVACADCHHVYEDGENVWKECDPVQKCSECHDPVEKVDGVMKLKLAYHKNCKTCHKGLVEKGEPEKAPFKKCTGCHKK